MSRNRRMTDDIHWWNAKDIHMKRLIVLIMVGLTLGFGWASLAGADSLGYYQEGDINLGGPAYAWWYGCSPTSAGMMMGFYDRDGYAGLSYDSLVPGGKAEATTFPVSNAWDALVKNVIASQGYVNDYYRFANGVPDTNSSGNAAYNVAGDDVAVPTHAANSLADFMGSGQDWVGNANGWTTFWYWTNHAKFYASDAAGLGLQGQDGMYGMDLYFRFAGYGTGDIASDMNFYTWHIKTSSSITDLGCTFADYKALIDAGLVVMIQLEGHSVFGYGYTTDGKIIFHDTWDDQEHTMDWGGSYAGMYEWGMTCFTPSGGGAVPLPPTVLLLGSGLISLALMRRRFKG